MTIYTFSNQHLSLSDPAQWLSDISVALIDEAAKVMLQALVGIPQPAFLNFTLAEVVEHFQGRASEADTLATISLFAAAEAALRIDFANRVKKRHKVGNKLNQAFRAAHAKKHARVSLIEDILDNWKVCEPSVVGSVSEFIKGLHTRNWIAHGRYWTFKQGKTLDFMDATLRIQTMASDLANTSSKFFPQPI